MKKKICHITTVHGAKDVRILLKECVSLVNAGYETELIVVGEPNSFEYKGVKIIGLGRKFSSRISRIRKAPGAAYNEANKSNAHIYHFHDPEFLPYARRLAKKGKKVIYDVHEDVPRQILAKFWIPKLFRKLIAAFVEHYENKTVKRISYVVTATSFIRERFKKITENVIDVNNYPIHTDFKINSNWENRENIVCYIGVIATARGVREMISAIEGSKAKLLLGGNFSEPGLREELIREQNWEKVEELGYCDRGKVWEVLASSKAGLVTLHPTENYKDALPVKMFEYMAAGIPVIASDFPLWKEIIEKNRCGLCVDPLDTGEIRKAIDFLVENNKESKKMGENGLEAVKQSYNWSREEKKLLSVYSNLINKEQ